MRHKASSGRDKAVHQGGCFVFKVLDVFSGIGGFSLGLEAAGMKTVAFCEIDPFCQKLLKHHWPSVPVFTDVRALNVKELEKHGIRTIDFISGGFPCQDLSIAGQKKGITGRRSGLWSELHRLIGELRPRFALIENVPNLLAGERGAWFSRVLGDLAEIGYDAQWHCIPAARLGAPHVRDRVWITAYPCRYSGKSAAKDLAYTPRGNMGIFDLLGTAINEARSQFDWETEFAKRELHSKPRVLRMDDGIPDVLDRLKALGNTIVPQIAHAWGITLIRMAKQWDIHETGCLSADKDSSRRL